MASNPTYETLFRQQSSPIYSLEEAEQWALRSKTDSKTSDHATYPTPPEDDYIKFVNNFWYEVPGAADLVWGWHMDELCKALEAEAYRVKEGRPKEGDLIINVPPASSKSTLANVLFIPWVWTFFPRCRFICATHTSSLGLDLASKSREVIRSEKYQKLYPHVRIHKDHDSKAHFVNTAGGDRFACTVAGRTPTGMHGHIFLTDDPLDPKKALSEVELESARKFITDVLPSRAIDKMVTANILIMQRLHDQDPTGVLLDLAKKTDSPIKHICLPAQLQDNVKPEGLKDKYVDGYMDPQRLGGEALRKLKLVMSAYAYAGQFGQNPVPLEGAMFKKNYFSNRVKAAPYNCVRVRYIDKAATQDGGAFTAGVLMAKDPDGNFYIEHVMRGQWEPVERNKEIKAVAVRDRSRYGPKHEPHYHIEREGGSGGKESGQYDVKNLAGFKVSLHKPGTSKEFRAEPWSCQLACGNVYIVDDGTWDVEAFITEHCQFPLGQFKDQVDAASGAFTMLVNSAPAQRFRTLPLGGKPRGGLRVWSCDHDTFPEVSVDGRVLLIFVDQVNVDRPVPPHSLTTLVDQLQIKICDIQPAGYQDKWDEEVPEYGYKPADLVMSNSQGKALWKHILKKYDPAPHLILVSAYCPNLAFSIARGIGDVLRIKREECLLDLTNEVRSLDDIPNKHVFEMVKKCRGLMSM